jgi:hypothetical protein
MSVMPHVRVMLMPSRTMIGSRLQSTCHERTIVWDPLHAACMSQALQWCAGHPKKGRLAATPAPHNCNWVPGNRVLGYREQSHLARSADVKARQGTASSPSVTTRQGPSGTDTASAYTRPAGRLGGGGRPGLWVLARTALRLGGGGSGMQRRPGLETAQPGPRHC